MAACVQSSPTPSLREDTDLYSKMLIMISQKIDQYLSNFQNHYILCFQESLLNVSANFKILSDALALDQQGIKLCNVKNLARRKERISLAGEVTQILEKFKSPNIKAVHESNSALRVSQFQITDKNNEERQLPPTPTLKESESSSKIFQYKDPIKRDSQKENPRVQDSTIFLGGEYAAADRSKNFSFFLPSINTSHMSSEYLNKSDREQGPLEVVEFKGVSQIARSRSPVAKAIQKVQKKYRESRSQSSDRAREKKEIKRKLGSNAATMSTDCLLKKQKFHSFIYTSKKLQKNEENRDYKHSESTEYGDYTVNIIQEGTRNHTVALNPESTDSFSGSKTLKQAKRMKDFLSNALESQKKESTFKHKRASMPEQEFEDKMGINLAPRNISPKPAESPVKLKLIEMEKETVPSPKSKRSNQKSKPPNEKKVLTKLKPSFDLTPRSQKGKTSSKRTPLSSHRLMSKPYEKEITQWNSCQRQKQSKMYSKQGSKVSNPDKSVRRKSSLGRMPRNNEEEKVRTPSRKESSKSAILVERRDRSASPPSKMNEESKKFSQVMEPHVLRQISQLQGSFLPPVAFVNREVLHNFLKYREHQIAVQCTLFDKKIHTAKEELDIIHQKKKFTLSKDTAKELRQIIHQNQWGKLLGALEEELIGNKDIVILRLYFTFLGKSFSGKNSTFIKQVTKFLWEVKPNFEFRLNPESHFVFTESVKKKVKELLISQTEEKYSSVETSKLGIFDVLTNILIEAMQYSALIPHRVETEIESMQQAKKEAKETVKLLERLRLKL